MVQASDGIPIEGLVVDSDYRHSPSFRLVKGGVQVEAGGRATAHRAHLTQIVIPEKTFGSIVLLRRRGFGSVEGPAVLWQYSDMHGQELVAVLKREREFQLHSGQYTYDGSVAADGSVTFQPLATSRAPRLNL